MIYRKVILVFICCSQIISCSRSLFNYSGCKGFYDDSVEVSNYYENNKKCSHCGLVRNPVGTLISPRVVYNNPVDIRQDFSLVIETTSQNNSSLSIQNLSSKYSLTFFVLSGELSTVVTIKENNPKPWRIVHNFNGSMLKVSNISQEDATLKLTLIDMSNRIYFNSENKTLE